MTDHHPDAAAMLNCWWHVETDVAITDTELTATLLRAFAGRGFAVVKVGEVPPWMEQPWASTAVGTKRITTWFTPDDPTGSFQTRVEGDEPDGARTMYVIKEQDR